MILVTLGTQDKKFNRLLENLEDQLASGKINDEVIVQAGYSSSFKSKHMKIFDLIPVDQFDDLIKKCDVLITHGGVGSIVTGLKNNKKIIAVARLKKYKEHTNDHQLQIIEQFVQAGYILTVSNCDDIYLKIKELKKFKPKKYKSNNKKFVDKIESLIDEYIK